jgi:hypothetical protein
VNTATVWTRLSIMTTESRVRILTTDRICVGTQPAVSLHRRSVAEGEIGMTEICATSSTTEMHAVESKISVKSKSASCSNDATRGTMITMVPSKTNLQDNTPLK